MTANQTTETFTQMYDKLVSSISKELALYCLSRGYSSENYSLEPHLVGSLTLFRNDVPLRPLDIRNDFLHMGLSVYGYVERHDGCKYIVEVRFRVMQ